MLDGCVVYFVPTTKVRPKLIESREASLLLLKRKSHFKTADNQSTLFEVHCRNLLALANLRLLLKVSKNRQPISLNNFHKTVNIFS